MELFNSLSSFKPENDFDKAAIKETFSGLVKMLMPFAPHICSEMGEIYGVDLRQWPVFDKNLAKDQTFMLIVQVNGKVKGKIEVEMGIDADEAYLKALEDGKVAKALEGKNIVKKIYIPNRLLNIVVK